jgi:Holliday junction DNA helicase RuvA
MRGESTQAIIPQGSNVDEAVTALVVLGYSEGEALSAISQLDASLPVEEIIKKALIGLARF